MILHRRVVNQTKAIARCQRVTLKHWFSLFGAPSSADSLYMDVRLAELPSGLGKVIVPNKVYVNRARGKGDYYKPDIAYNDINWTTDKLLEKIKQL